MLHAKLSASSSHRWLSCTGSIKAEQGIKDSTSVYAAEGTTAHAVADMILNGANHKELIGETIEGFLVSQDMINHVQNYVDYVQSIGGEQFYEVRVDFSNIVPEGFGTSDAIAIVDKTIHVIDLKYGQGLKVDAKDNSQGMLYAIGVVNDYGFIYELDTVEIHIYQPRINNYSSWTISVEDLNKWAIWVKDKANEALSDNAPKSPSEKACNFCKAKATCKTLSDHVNSIVACEFEDLTNPDTLNDVEILNIMNNKKLINGWLDAVEEHVTSRLKDGENVEGFKLVSGRSSRKWLNEDEVEAKLLTLISSNDIFKKTLISPAQAEKILGKKRLPEIEDLIIKNEGSPTLAFADDSRKSISENIKDSFTAL